MTGESRQLEEFFQQCRKWSVHMADLDAEPARYQYMRREFPALLGNRPLVSSLLERLAAGDAAVKSDRGGLFENEILLYLDPRRLFSVRLYFHAAGQFTPIHDHSAWGISGTPFGVLGVVRYQRVDDRTDAAQVRLEKSRELMLPPGAVDVVHPLDAGIHQTGSPTEHLNVMISAYGRPVRRLYIRTFDADTGRVTRHFPPKIRQRRFAREALALLDSPPSA
jgi:predicted metal-dependent enzyme (double-stranded beta helix superfamily)